MFLTTAAIGPSTKCDLMPNNWTANRMQPSRTMLYDRARSGLSFVQAGWQSARRPLSQQLASLQIQPLFDPLSPELISDPYPFYHRLRAEDPVHHSPLGFHVLSRHADVSSVLRDKCFGKDFVGQTTQRHGAQVLEEPVYRSMRHWMLTQNPPDHTRLRGLVVQVFTARRVEEMRPRIQQIVDATLDRIAPRRYADLIADFAFRLPVTVICEMLGIPQEDHEMFLTGARQSGRLLDPVPLSSTELDAANAYTLSTAAYFQQLFERRRREPGDDLTTRLVQAEEQGSRLTNEELTANIILLFGAGHETTVNLIGNGLLALHRNPDQLKLLRENPSLTPNAIEELLRYDSSVQATGRTALDDVEVGGIGIRKGEAVLCPLGAANHDPAIYPEPNRLDITRANIRRCRSGAASISASALNSPGSRPRLRLQPCCAACRISLSTILSTPIGGRLSSSAA
jgi:cytochrome P450